jgi:hypothetical protein
MSQSEEALVEQLSDISSEYSPENSPVKIHLMKQHNSNSGD